MEVVCSSCKQTRTVVRDTGTLCRPCASLNRRTSAYSETGFYHKCLDCEVEWSTKTDTKAVRCKACAAKMFGSKTGKMNRKSDKEKVVYNATCTNCGLVRTLKANPKNLKTTLCSACSKRRTGKSYFITPLMSLDAMNEMIKASTKTIYFRICDLCPPETQVKQVVSSTNSGHKPCNKHARKPSGEERKRVTSYKKRKVKVTAETVSSLAIEKQRKINREHRAIIEEEKKAKSKVKVHTQVEMDKEISKWLEDNKPSVTIPENEPFPYLGHQMYRG